MHPMAPEADLLVAYLQTDAVITRLIQANALEGSRERTGPGLQVDWDRLRVEMATGEESLRKIFLR